MWKGRKLMKIKCQKGLIFQSKATIQWKQDPGAQMSKYYLAHMLKDGRKGNRIGTLCWKAFRVIFNQHLINTYPGLCKVLSRPYKVHSRVWWIITSGNVGRMWHKWKDLKYLLSARTVLKVKIYWLGVFIFKRKKIPKGHFYLSNIWRRMFHFVSFLINSTDRSGAVVR